MTEFDKPVTRRTTEGYRVLYAKKEKIVVTLQKGDIIEFRTHHRRRIWHLPVEQAYRIAIKNEAMLESERALMKEKLSGQKFLPV